MSNMGYPGVPGSPTDPGPREKTEPVKVLGSDAVNALVQTSSGEVKVVDKQNLRK